jgi:hypothetical protein
MTEQDRLLFLKDLCARLSYDVKLQYKDKDYDFLGIDRGRIFVNIARTGEWLTHVNTYEVKPYLRPMSSMTEKEYETFPIPYSFDSFSTWNNTILSEMIEGTQILIGIDEITEITDWLNAHHFDYRGLIPKGLALEAPEGMYESKK